MSLRDGIAAIARGDAHIALLGNCRCEWAGGEAYGEKAIRELFRAAPLDVTAGTVIEDATGFAWFGGGDALFADLYEGRIGRLWRIGPGARTPIEPAVAVAFDSDRAQVREEVAFRAADHPALAADAVQAVIAAGRALLWQSDGAEVHHARAFVLRAFGDAARGAALFALYRLGGGAVRASGFAYGAACFGAKEAHAIDRPAVREWMPRL